MELIQMPSTKEQVTGMVMALTDKLNNGEVNPLDALLRIKMLEKAIDQIKPILNGLVLPEASKYGKSFDYKGCRMEIKEAGVKYDYSGCGHAEYNELCNNITELLAQKKAYEKLLSSLPTMMPIVSTEGEVMEVNPPVKSSTTIVSVTIKC